MKVMIGLVRRRDFFVFGCSIMWAILSIREWRCQAIDQVLLHEIIFFFFCFSVFSSSEVLGKISSIRSKLPTAACWSREKKRGNCEANLLSLFYVESDFGTTEPQTNHSQYFSPVEALNLIVDSKSQPVELDNSTLGVTCAIEATEKLAIVLFCEFWFPYFNAIWYDLRCHVAWLLKFR